MTLTIIRETGEFLGRAIVNYACSCGSFETDKVLIEDEPRANEQLRAHWAAQHEDVLREMGMGLCGVCGRLTDHLKILTELGDGFLCDVHAPAHRLRAIFSETQR